MLYIIITEVLMKSSSMIPILLFLLCIPAIAMEKKPHFAINKLKKWLHKASVPGKKQQVIPITTEQSSPIFLLPTEVQNLIAEYLTFYDKETDSECYRRTKNLCCGSEDSKINYLNGIIKLKINKSFPNHLSEIFPRHLTIYNKISKEKKLLHHYSAHHSSKLDAVLFNCSANCSKIILLKPMSCISYKIKIFDVVTGSKINEFKYFCRQSGVPHEIAISNGGTSFAQLYKNSTNDYSAEIQSTEDCHRTNKWHNITLPSVTALAFNQQGTKIFVHGPNDEFQIIPLCSAQEDKAISRKTFIDYCKQRRICKTIQ